MLGSGAARPVGQWPQGKAHGVSKCTATQKLLYMHLHLIVDFAHERCDCEHVKRRPATLAGAVEGCIFTPTNPLDAPRQHPTYLTPLCKWSTKSATHDNTTALVTVNIITLIDLCYYHQGLG